MKNNNANNQRQNIEIAVIQEQVKSLRTRLDTFISNDFEHFKKEVKEEISFNRRTYIAGIAITILVIFLSRLI